MELTEQDISNIRRDIKRRGVTSPNLQEDLLDHICILMELQPTNDFKTAYSKAIAQFDSFKKIQSLTIQEIERAGLLAKALKILEYTFTFFYILLGVFSLILPPLLFIYQSVEIFILFSPLLMFGYLICFKRIDYKKFELILFKK